MGNDPQTRGDSDGLAATDLDFWEVGRELAAHESIPVKRLRVMWYQFRHLPECPPDIHLQLGERVLRCGEPILAYDILRHGLERLESRTSNASADHLWARLKQQLALALAQSGATRRANRILGELRDNGHVDSETLGLLGRTYKDLALNAPQEEWRQAHLRHALENYRRGFERGCEEWQKGRSPEEAAGACYCGINAATIFVLLQDASAARALSERVRDLCLARIRGPGADADYWLSATLGEAELILGHHEESRKQYQAAIHSAAGNWRDLASMRRQVRLLASGLGVLPESWEDLFPVTSVAVLESPAWSHYGNVSEAWAARVHAEFERRIRHSGIVAAYFTIMSPADVLFGEALVRSGVEAHIVLSYPRQDCQHLFAENSGWRARFDSLLTRAASVIDDIERSCPDVGANQRFAAIRALGSAWLRAQWLGASLVLWRLEDGQGPSAESAEERWTGDIFRSERCWEPIRLPAGEPSVLEPTLTRPADALPHPLRRRDSAASRIGEGLGEGTLRKGAADLMIRVASRRQHPQGGTDAYDVRAMLFADVSGYSRLSDVSLFRFSQVFLRRIQEVLQPFEGRILSRRTAGDGLFLVFADVTSAAAVAMQLSAAIAQMNWEELSLPSHLGMRISLDAGPVYIFHNPVTETADVCGAHVNRAARIEPITPPNQVYASEAFASLYVASGGNDFQFDYVGQTQLPKGFGLTPLYCVVGRYTELKPM